jgi:hypothetical protein
MRAPTFAPWLLLLLTYGSPKRYSTVNAFVVHQVPLTHPVTRTLRHAVCLAANNQNDDTPQTDTSNNRQIGVGRRGTLMTLLGGAVSFAAGDLALNAAVKVTGVAGNAVVTAGGGLYERVLAFGNKYRGAAIASEELTAWTATQKVALTPEIRSWLAAQKRLQLVRKTAMATAAASRAKTTARAAVIRGGGGGVVEEGILAAAATAAVKSISQTQDTDAISSNDENDLNTQNTEITDALEAKEESTSLTTSSTDKNTLDDSISPSANEDEPLS